MASVESLSDSEIRLKLNELGYPAGPITATTRKVLVKKLKLLLEQQSTTPNDKKDGKSQVSLSSFSSGEESEDDAKVNSRSSMPPPPPKSGKRRSVSRSKETNSTNHNFDDTSLNNYLVPSANSTLKPRESPKRKIENHNGENISLSSVQEFPRRSVRNSVSPSNKVKPILKDDPFDTGSDSDLGSENDVRNYSASKGSLFKNHKPLKDESSNLSFGGSEFAQSIRSRFQTVSAGTSDNSEFSNYTSLYRRSKTGDDSQLFKNTQPFSSDFVRKLSASSNKTISGFNSGLSSKLLNVKESDEENQPSPYFYSQIKSRLHKNDVPKTDEGRLWRNTTTVSMTLLLVVVLFFSFLIIVYLNVTYKDAPVEEADTQFPICRSNGKAGVECILDADMEPAMNLFKELYHDLQKHAISVKCKGNTEEISTLTDNQLIQIVVEKNSNLNVWDVENQLKNVKVLINANPKWGIEITDKGLDIPSPALPFTCSALNFVYSVFGFGLRLVFVLIAFFIIYKTYQWWKERRDRNRKEVYDLVESIIELLNSNQQEGGSYLPINHARDQLIPPHQRERMAGIWKEAVKYLEENDSRVRVEVQQVAGEEFQVWHWLQSPRPNGKRKVWQGQAFDTMEGSVNSLPVSPTPCLKIRQMFEPNSEMGDEWVTGVQDAILEKCEGIEVLHIAVDRNSLEGCVYVKCSSSEQAGRAYRALHGSWFDGKLVTVKYLRLERYHSRFPEAARTSRLLLPSNDRKLSLQ